MVILHIGCLAMPNTNVQDHSPGRDILVRWFIIGWAWVSCFCHGTQTMDNSRICHCLLFHEHGKQTLCSHFFGQGTYYATHTLGLNFTMRSWAKSLAPFMSVIMHDPYLKQTQLPCVIWRYSLWAPCPCLSWSAVTFSRSISVELDSS